MFPYSEDTPYKLTGGWVGGLVDAVHEPLWLLKLPRGCPTPSTPETLLVRPTGAAAAEALRLPQAPPERGPRHDISIKTTRTNGGS